MNLIFFLRSEASLRIFLWVFSSVSRQSRDWERILIQVYFTLTRVRPILVYDWSEVHQSIIICIWEYFRKALGGKNNTLDEHCCCKKWSTAGTKMCALGLISEGSDICIDCCICYGVGNLGHTFIRTISFQNLWYIYDYTG